MSMEITFERFVHADNELDFCTELTDDQIVSQVMADSDNSHVEKEEPTPAPHTTAELMRALMTLSSVHSDDMTLAHIEANVITCKRNAVQTEINKFFKPLQL